MMCHQLILKKKIKKQVVHKYMLLGLFCSHLTSALLLSQNAISCVERHICHLQIMNDVLKYVQCGLSGFTFV